MNEIIDFNTATKTINTGRVYTCNVCGKQSTWVNGWMWKYIFRKGSGNGDPGWEETFKTCSDECRGQEYAGE